MKRENKKKIKKIGSKLFLQRKNIKIKNNIIKRNIRE